jgi:hypothetical protein
MKCIKSIKSATNKEVGSIIRINDTEAHQRVKSGFWVYVPKSEYKALRKPTKSEVEVKETKEKVKKSKK